MSNIVNSETASIDALEQELHACESLIGRIRRRQTQLLAQLDRAQVHFTDGSRSMVEWAAARLDVTHDTAGLLMNGAKVLAEHSDSDSRLAEGSITFDRALATARLAVAGVDAQVIDASAGFDLGGLARLAARHRRITRTQERAAFRERYVMLQPTLDRSSWQLSGRLPGAAGNIVEEALLARAEALPDPVEGGRTGGRRRADALVSIAQDSMADSERNSGAGPHVTVFVEASVASGTGGESGAEIGAGPRVGPQVLEGLLCEGTVSIVALEGLRPVAASSSTRAIPPALRRTVLWRDGGCVIDGCRSRYRLQPHHITLRSEGGSHDAENLATLCWYHHHVAVHGAGFRVDPQSPPGRRRLIPPASGPDPPA